MSLIITLILGGFVGWLAARLLGREEGVVASIVIGVIGSVLGSWISSLLTGGNKAYLSFSLSGLVWSFVGSVVLVAILNAVTRRNHKSTF
jgi:uncharacterized membrane protein YeaQ/YmgE (transglycosylase-associated protein family)